TPIIRYSAVHTGPNTQLGSVPGGWVSEGYQCRTALVLTAAPAAPTSRHRPTNPTSASTGETGVDDPGDDDPHSFGPVCWKTPSPPRTRQPLLSCRTKRAGGEPGYQPFTRGHTATTSSPPSTTW